MHLANVKAGCSAF